MSTASHVICIPRADSDDQAATILINIEVHNATTFDLKIIATDGSDVYTGTLNTSKATSARDKSYKTSDSNWHSTLSKFLLGTKSPKASQSAIENAELVALVKEQKTIELRVRQHVEGITQRMGSITLTWDEEQGIELFDWAATAASSRDVVEREVSELQAKFEASQSTSNRLRTQLDELIEAKKMHEDQMLEKFRQLLNTKKLKIRDQQRLLAGATIDPKIARDVKEARRGGVERDEAVLKGAKRKANGKTTDEDGEDVLSEDEGFERNAETSASSEGETDNEVAAESSRYEAPVAKAASQTMKQEDAEDLPTKRELPFAARNTAKASIGASNAISADDEETDDEL